GLRAFLFDRAHADALDLWKLPVPVRVDAADAVVERWVRREQARDSLFQQRVREAHVAHFADVGVIQVRALFESADLSERAGDAVRVARELDGAGIGQVLALPRHRGLDQVAEEGPRPPEDEKAETDQHHLPATPLAIRRAARGAADQKLANDGDAHDAKDQGDEPDVEPHVAVEDVAELVADDALQLIAGQIVE